MGIKCRYSLYVIFHYPRRFLEPHIRDIWQRISWRTQALERFCWNTPNCNDSKILCILRVNLKTNAELFEFTNAKIYLRKILAFTISLLKQVSNQTKQPYHAYLTLLQHTKIKESQGKRKLPWKVVSSTLEGPSDSSSLILLAWVNEDFFLFTSKFRLNPLPIKSWIHLYSSTLLHHAERLPSQQMDRSSGLELS